MTRRRAFTLLETLLAIGLSGLLIAGLMGLTLRTGRSAAILGERAARDLSVDVFFERLEHELMFAVVVGDAGRAGVRGGGGMLEIQSDQAWGGSGNTGLVRTRFAFEADTGELSIERTSEDAETMREVMPARLGAVRMRFWDGRGWTDQWDSRQEDAMPVLVEVAVWFDAIQASEDGAIGPLGGIAPGDDASDDRPEFEGAPIASMTPVAAREPRPGAQADRRRILAIPDAGRPTGEPNAGRGP